MRELYTPELMVLVKELKAFENFFIDKFYESEKDKFRIKVSRKGEKANILCILPYTINATEYIEEAEQASNFAIAVRKRITGFMIESIGQLGHDRIIIIKLKKGDDRANLILEMFGHGNMVLTDENMGITLAYNVHSFKDREIRPKAVYTPPQSSAIDISQASAILDGIVDSIARTSEDKNAQIGKTLAKGLGIGTMYLENALSRLGINPKEKLSEMKDVQIKPIADSIIEEVISCLDKPEFTIYKDNEMPIDFALTKISKYEKKESQTFETFQKMLDEFYRNASKKEEQESPEAIELRKSIEKQRDLLKEIDDDISSNKAIGDEIFSKISEINKIIAHAKERKRATKEELQELSQSIKILDVNLKDKTLTIETSENQ
ncbi:MAG: NFACT family protein [Candidatus Micrarchaeota archaeon]|nr:NFACT family protein [Candidatus Micrarchaeota archaeon]